MSVALKFLAWFSILALGVASWTPGQDMVRTGLNTRFEHATAYLVATFVVALAYPKLKIERLAAMLIAYAAVLELGQLLVPGRHSDWHDWIASSSGVVVGVGLSILFGRARLST